MRLLDKPGELVQYVKDRPGHDFRYAIETSQSLLDMGWKSKIDFEDGLKDTIEYGFRNKFFRMLKSSIIVAAVGYCGVYFIRVVK